MATWVIVAGKQRRGRPGGLGGGRRRVRHSQAARENGLEQPIAGHAGKWEWGRSVCDCAVRAWGGAHALSSCVVDGDSDGRGRTISPWPVRQAERAGGRESVGVSLSRGGGEAGAHDEVPGRVVGVSRRVSLLFFASRDNAPRAPCRPGTLRLRSRVDTESFDTGSCLCNPCIHSGLVIPVAISPSPQALLQQLLPLADLGAVVPPQ